jgi:hypothetical protein
MSMALRNRLAMVTLTVSLVAGATLLTGSPAHAEDDRSGCVAVAQLSDYSYRMWEWHLAFYGDLNPNTLAWYNVYVGYGELYNDYCR